MIRIGHFTDVKQVELVFKTAQLTDVKHPIIWYGN